MQEKKPGLFQRLKDGFVALLISASLFLPYGKAKAAKPSPDPEEKTIQERVEDIREKLREQAAPDQVDPSGQSPQPDQRLSQWWRNWPNWNDWANWGNWGNWGNWR
jgi:rSAM-associated Gly-rich repeat protein